MLILLFFSFISGLVTILAPCIWPLLPIVLSSSSTGGKRKSLGITLGVMGSFAFFTITISYLVSLFNIDPDIFRILAVAVLLILGLSLIIPRLAVQFERVVSGVVGMVRLNRGDKDGGFLTGLVTGLALGIVWSPCAGPILATIATLSATRAVSLELILVTLVYVTGVGIPLFFFAYGGNLVISRARILSPYLGKIRQTFGIVIILTAFAIFTNYDKVLQVKLLTAFPSYTSFLTQLESSPGVSREISRLKGNKEAKVKTGEAVNPIDMGATGALPKIARAPEFVGISKWLNTPEPLTMEKLRGKVVLIDFWTYTCINCIRTLPFVTRWYDTYKDKGLVVVGVHTPEFEFEKKTQNVANAIEQYKIHYPVAQDNDYATWNAYDNHYWPAKYLIDKDGYIRKFHFGEGEYDEMEEAIRTLLQETGSTIDAPMVSLPDQTPNGNLTPESYLGLARMDRFASEEELQLGKHTYTIAGKIPLHHLAYEGTWNITDEMGEATNGAAIELRFLADKVFLVITPKGGDDAVRVYLDAKPVQIDNAGSDVVNGIVKLDTERLYELINLHGNKGEHILRLEFENDGTAVYAFTFG